MTAPCHSLWKPEDFFTVGLTLESWVSQMHKGIADSTSITQNSNILRNSFNVDLSKGAKEKRKKWHVGKGQYAPCSAADMRASFPRDSWSIVDKHHGAL